MAERGGHWFAQAHLTKMMRMKAQKRALGRKTAHPGRTPVGNLLMVLGKLILSSTAPPQGAPTVATMAQGHQRWLLVVAVRLQTAVRVVQERRSQISEMGLRQEVVPTAFAIARCPAAMWAQEHRKRASEMNSSQELARARATVRHRTAIPKGLSGSVHSNRAQMCLLAAVTRIVATCSRISRQLASTHLQAVLRLSVSAAMMLTARQTRVPLCRNPEVVFKECRACRTFAAQRACENPVVQLRGPPCKNLVVQLRGPPDIAQPQI